MPKIAVPRLTFQPGDHVQIKTGAVYGHFSGQVGTVQSQDDTGWITVGFRWPGDNKIMAFRREESAGFSAADLIFLSDPRERRS